MRNAPEPIPTVVRRVAGHAATGAVALLSRFTLEACYGRRSGSAIIFMSADPDRLGYVRGSPFPARRAARGRIDPDRDEFLVEGKVALERRESVAQNGSAPRTGAQGWGET